MDARAPVPGETKAQPPYAPMRPTWCGKRSKRCARMACVLARGAKKTSLYRGMCSEEGGLRWFVVDGALAEVCCGAEDIKDAAHGWYEMGIVRLMPLKE